jgi:hypothetical protein
MPISSAGAAPANLCMLRFGHASCISFHLTALYFGAAYLLLTIPVHLIYAAVAFAKEDGAVRRRNTHALCTECNELVLTGSNICEQCRCNLLAQA